MSFECARSISIDQVEHPPAWVLDVLSDLQKVADKRGLANFSAELNRMQTCFRPDAEDAAAI